MPHVYVTRHKNPHTDTIASALGEAEVKDLVAAENNCAPARLGKVNPQTAWALEKSGAEEPRLLEHIMLRVKDVMAHDVAVAHKNDPLRNVGLTMAQRNISQVPIVDDDGSLVGIITERNLARMYVRESRGASSFKDSPVSVGAMLEVLEGELLVGEDRESEGQLWVISMAVDSMGKSMKQGDGVGGGDRPEARRGGARRGGPGGRGPAVGDLDGRGLDGQVHEAGGRRGRRGPPRGPEAGHRPRRRGSRDLERLAARRRGPSDGRGARDDRGALGARLLRDQPPDTDLRSLLGGDEREPAHRPPRRPYNGDNRAGNGGPLPREIG